ncbi:hypothetical protein [Longimicrobium sp.]|uniref:D-alanine--D-alanine ligase family protein n=1 Tax=Longimicrobium sp. TaxID=2029185 RepID=UPI002E313153|nr:hypothetical protein [Longimicrobium sp.]HEX6040932.1 hypothetical protein [Longimicrobium sp.]
MRIGFIYDVREHVFGIGEDGLVNELATELFSPSQANDLIAALKACGHQVEVVDGAREFLRQLPAIKERIDFVFNEAKGLYGPDRKMAVPALCRIHGLPFLGSDAYAVTLARNKFHTLAVAALCGIPIPPSALVTDPAGTAGWSVFPAIVKPNYESSSIGITDQSVVDGPDTLRAQVAHVLDTYGQPALVQAFIEGVEVQVPVIGNASPRALELVELVVPRGPGNPHGIVRNEDWVEDSVDFALYKGDPVLGAWLREQAVRGFRALGCADYARLDFRVDPHGRAYFIEAATHPDIFQDSSFVLAARAAGLEFVPLIGGLVEGSVARQRSGG